MKTAAGHCPLCGGVNDCQLCTVATYKGPCWCVRVKIPEELLAQIPSEQRNQACLCRNCVMEFHRAQEGRSTGLNPKTGVGLQKAAKLEGVGTSGGKTFCPGVGNAESRLASRSLLASVKSVSEFELKIRPGDFYFENGLMVFTAAYHSRRGYCCDNNCRHCPYPAFT